LIKCSEYLFLLPPLLPPFPSGKCSFPGKRCFKYRVYKHPPSVTFYFEFDGVKIEWDCWALKIIKTGCIFSKNGGGRRKNVLSLIKTNGREFEN
jgi:hypothetical protein